MQCTVFSILTNLGEVSNLLIRLDKKKLFRRPEKPNNLVDSMFEITGLQKI